MTYKLLLIILVALLSLGCTQSDFTRNAALPAGSMQVMVRRNGLSDRCMVVVTVRAAEQDIRLDVTAWAEAGIVFEGAGERAAQYVDMLAYESRELHFPCMVDAQQLRLPGEYVVRAQASYSGADQLFAQAESVALVTIRANGARQVLDKANEDAAFDQPFRPGQLLIACAIQPEAAARPLSANVYVKIHSPYDDYAPIVTILIKPGVRFAPEAGAVGVFQAKPYELTLQPGTIAEGGSRLLAIPVFLEDGAQAGTYNMKVTVDDNGRRASEYAAEAIEVAFAEGGYSLAATAHGQSKPVAPGMEPLAGVGGQMLSSPTSESSPTPQGAAVETALPASALSDVEITAWDLHLTGYSGDRWDLWLGYIRHYSPISWPAFNVAVAQHNPHLAADGYRFLPEKSYVLPGAALSSSLASLDVN